MERKKIDLFIEMAQSESYFFSIQDVQSTKGRIAKTRCDAYKKVRELLGLQAEYENFAISVLDDQMTFVEESEEFSDIEKEIYVNEYSVDRYDVFQLTWCLVEDIFERGWAWDRLYKKSGEKHKVCKEIRETIDDQYNRNIELNESYFVKEEALKRIENPTDYHCQCCGTIFYARYRSKYSAAPKCPVCETQEWMMIE